MRRVYNLMQLSCLHYVVEFDIKGFFDNVNHSKLIRQIWSLGIRDKQLIYLIKQILKAPIKMPNGKLVFPEKGTPQAVIQKNAGHANPATTEHYTRISDDAARRYANVLQLPMAAPDVIEAKNAETEPERAELHRLADTLSIDQIKKILQDL